MWILDYTSLRRGNDERHATMIIGSHNTVIGIGERPWLVKTLRGIFSQCTSNDAIETSGQIVAPLAEWRYRGVEMLLGQLLRRSARKHGRAGQQMIENRSQS